MTAETTLEPTCADCSDDCLPASAVVLCKLHRAAPALLEAAEWAFDAMSSDQHNDCDIDTDACHAPDAASDHVGMRALHAATEAATS